MLTGSLDRNRRGDVAMNKFRSLALPVLKAPGRYALFPTCYIAWLLPQLLLSRIPSASDTLWSLATVCWDQVGGLDKTGRETFSLP